VDLRRRATYWPIAAEAPNILATGIRPAIRNREARFNTASEQEAPRGRRRGGAERGEEGAAPVARRSVGASSALYRHIVGCEIVSFFMRRLYCIGLEGLRPRILWALPVPANHLFARHSHFTA